MKRELGLLGILTSLMFAMGLISRYFFTAENLLGMTRHLAEVGIIGCAMTLVILTGGIDLSVGAIFGLSCIALGYSWEALGPFPAVGLCFLTGLLCGGLNGFLIAQFRLPPLIVTLATMALFRGTAMVVSKAQPVSGFSEAFSWIGQGSFGNVPLQLIVWICVLGITLWAAHRTGFGRHLRAIGDQERAAFFAAVPVKRVVLTVYGISGVLCGLGALIFTSRMSTAKADAGLGMELDVITAVVLGGTRITGGQGSVLGTFLGVLILGVLRNGLSLGGISTVWQAMLGGLLLIVTAMFNEMIIHRQVLRRRHKNPPTTSNV